jgi:hypothetical protein
MAFCSPDGFVFNDIHLCEKHYQNLLNFVHRDKSCYQDKVNRAAGRCTVVMVFASPSGQFYHDVTTSYHLSRLSHLDNFIVTPKSCPLTGTMQKRMPTLTQTATPYTTGPLAVRHPANKRLFTNLMTYEK